VTRIDTLVRRTRTRWESTRAGMSSVLTGDPENPRWPASGVGSAVHGPVKRSSMLRFYAPPV
jgi:hypothetical protein